MHVDIYTFIAFFNTSDTASGLKAGLSNTVAMIWALRLLVFKDPSFSVQGYSAVHFVLKVM